MDGSSKAPHHQSIGGVTVPRMGLRDDVLQLNGWSSGRPAAALLRRYGGHYNRGFGVLHPTSAAE